MNDNLLIDGNTLRQISTLDDSTVWDNVGVYYTPFSLTDSFSNFIYNEKIFSKSENIDVLDIFAGDGRLGRTIGKRFNKFINSITYVEVRQNTLSPSSLNGKTKVILQNGFDLDSSSKYGLIVSNPPFLILNTKSADELGISWARVKEGGRNLYGLGILKALEVCIPGGFVAVIAPFGYLRGINSAGFRQLLEQHCSEVRIRANSNRTVFEGVNQDIAFQLFKKRSSSTLGTKWKFTYGANKYKLIHVNLPFTQKTADKYVRVGPIVWNRKKEFLKDNPNNNILVIYGGNISHKGNLSFPLNKYKEKQYINRLGTIPTDLLSAPFIAIRRTLRGKPGSWIIDSTLINDQKLICTAENHVIIVELPKLKIKLLKEIQIKLIDSIGIFYFDSGSPNISTKVVGQLFSKLIVNYL